MTPRWLLVAIVRRRLLAVRLILIALVVLHRAIVLGGPIVLGGRRRRAVRRIPFLLAIVHVRRAIGILRHILWLGFGGRRGRRVLRRPLLIRWPLLLILRGLIGLRLLSLILTLRMRLILRLRLILLLRGLSRRIVEHQAQRQAGDDHRICAARLPFLEVTYLVFACSHHRIVAHLNAPNTELLPI